MLMTLPHLLALVPLSAAAWLGCVPIARSTRLGDGGMLVICLLLHVLLLAVLAWPVFRLLSLRPLILPACPSCGKPHADYRIPREAWPEPVITCVHCGARLRLVLSAAALRQPSTLPTLALRWPGFLGIWRRVEVQQPR
jgi:hypothetical protein